MSGQQQTTAPLPATPAAAELPKGRWYALAILTAIMVVNQIDRTVISVIIEPIKHEFQVDDAAMGLLAGLTHSVAMALFVLPFGWLADRSGRVKLMSIVVIVWSGLTALSAAAQSYLSLLLLRFGVGAAEAGGPPVAISLLSDMFSAKERPTVMGVYYMHVAIGTGLVFLFGGWIAHEFGWRAAFLIAGMPGLICGLLLLFTVREPPRVTSSIAEAPRMAEALGLLLRNRAVTAMLVGGPLATIAQISTWTWMASFFIRVHGLNLAEVGIIGAVVLGIGKAMGSALSGPLTRRFSGGRPKELWRYPALALCCTIPVGWLFVSVPSVSASIGAAMVLSFLMGGWPGPAMVILMEGAPARLRGSCVSLYQLCTSMLGAATGALLTGLISDAYGENGIGPAIATVLSVNAGAALAFYVACSFLPKTPAPLGPEDEDLIAATH